MTTAARQWADSFVALVRGTGRLWLKVGPALLGVYACTWTASRVIQIGAAWLGAKTPIVQWTNLADGTYDITRGPSLGQWVVVVLVAFSFLAMLIGLIVCLRLLGDQLEADGLVPTRETDAPGRRSLGQTLSVTLVAFLGIYTLFGQLTEAANQVASDAIAITHDPLTLLFVPLMPKTWPEAVSVLAVLAVAFGVRKLVDGARKKRPGLALGLASAGLEVFYLLAMFVVGARLMTWVRDWTTGRQMGAWLNTASGWLADLFALFHISLPDVWTTAWSWWWDTGWPVVLSSVLQPLLWLALTAVVMGTHMVSFKELLRSGKLGQRVGGRRAATLVAGVESEGLRQDLFLQTQGLVWGSLEGKYMPAFNALRHTLRAGVGFLGAFIISFGLLDLARNWATYWLHAFVGEIDMPTLFYVFDLFDFGLAVVFMPLQLCLLATAFGLAFGAGQPSDAGQPDAAEVTA